MTVVGVYNEISPVPGGSHLGSALGLRPHFIVFPSSNINTSIEFIGMSKSQLLEFRILGVFL